jgi:hypothetical protein
MKGSGCGLIETLSRHLPEGTEETHAIPRIRIRIANPSTTTVSRKLSSRMTSIVNADGRPTL